MKKVTIDEIKELIENEEIPMFPTQASICIPIINRIYLKMINGLKFDEIKVCEGLIIDGHHRYISSLLAEKMIGTVPANKSSSTKIYKWEVVNFVDVEWDTIEKIDKLNRDDAEYNNITLDKIYEMTK